MNELYGKIIQEIAKGNLEKTKLTLDDLANITGLPKIDIKIFLEKVADETESQNIYDYIQAVLST